MKVSHSHIVGGFRGSGIWLLNPEAVREEKLLDGAEPDAEQSTANSQEPNTPRKLLRECIVNAITPPLSAENRQCVEQSKKRRKRIQAEYGEVMTSSVAVERLRLEEIDRTEKRERRWKQQ